MKFKKLQNIVFVVFLCLIIASLVTYKGVTDEQSLEDFQIIIKDLDVWAPIAFISLYTVATIFIPSTPFMILSGLLFGFKEGLLYSIIGGLLSAIIVFFISRNLGKEWVESVLQHKYLRKLGDYNKRLERGAIWDLAILRILPIMPFNILNILMGVSRINIRDYIFGTIIGLAPSNVISVYFGNLLTKLF